MCSCAWVCVYVCVCELDLSEEDEGVCWVYIRMCVCMYVLVAYMCVHASNVFICVCRCV